MMLWSEGLAVYVSQSLNPGATTDDLVLAKVMIEQTDARLPELASDLALNLRSTEESLHADYFYAFGTDRVPARCGYYIGLRVVQALRRDRSLKALAGLNGAALYTEIEDALRSLQTTPP